MLLLIHHSFRYLIAISGAVVIAYALHGMAKGRPHDDTMRKLAVTFRSMLDLGVFTGIVLVMTDFGFRRDLGVHVALGILAAAVGHVVPVMMRGRRKADRTLLPYVVATATAMLLVLLGGLSLLTSESGGETVSSAPAPAVTATLSA